MHQPDIHCETTGGEGNRTNKTLRMVCVELEKAFDRVDRELLWQVVERYGVRGRLKEAVESLYCQSEVCVQVQGKNSEWFEVAMRVRHKGAQCHPGCLT